MTNLVATIPITAKAMKSLYAELNRQKDLNLKQSYKRKYKDLQAVVPTTTDPHVSLQQPAVATRYKVNAGPQVLKATPKGQGKKLNGKGKGVRPPDKGKKNIVKTSTSGAVTSAGPSSNLRSKLQDQARVTATMIQELTDELQAIEQESLNDEQGSEAMQESNLEQEDSEDCLMDDEEQRLFKMQDLPSLYSEQKELKTFPKRTDVTSHQLRHLNENGVNRTEEVIIGSEQGTTFPTKVCNTMCNALIDTGATRSCMSEKYYKKLHLAEIHLLQNVNVKSATSSNLAPVRLVNYTFKLGKTEFNSEFIVCKNLTRPLILGRDFLI